MNLVSNMISIIKVGSIAKHLVVTVRNSKLCINILNVLYRLGYIRGFSIENKKCVKVFLKYIDNKPIIRNIDVISTPGRRTYTRCGDLRLDLKKKGSGFYIISTDKGLLTDEESVIFSRGGEVLLKIS
jgi:small subunit ribosomal protein S8